MNNLELEKNKTKNPPSSEPTDIFVAYFHNRSLSSITFISSSFLSVLALSKWKRQKQLSKPLEIENVFILLIKWVK